MEELLVQYLVAVFAPHGKEDVASDKFMDDFALGGDALKDNVLLVAQLDHHVSCLPVDVPGLKYQHYNRPGLTPCPHLDGVVSPGGEMLPVEDAHPHDSVVGDAQQLLPPLAVELHHKQTDAELWQRLPGSDKVLQPEATTQLSHDEDELLS